MQGARSWIEACSHGAPRCAVPAGQSHTMPIGVSHRRTVRPAVKILPDEATVCESCAQFKNWHHLQSLLCYNLRDRAVGIPTPLLDPSPPPLAQRAHLCPVIVQYRWRMCGMWWSGGVVIPPRARKGGRSCFSLVLVQASHATGHGPEGGEVWTQCHCYSEVSRVQSIL